MHCLEYGVVKNPPKLSVNGCLLAIHERLGEALKVHGASAVALESVIYVQSLSTALVLGAARGVVLLTAAQAGLPTFEYAPRRVKQAVVGKGGAQKDQVGFMVRALLGLTVTPPPDAADAIAVGITHFQSVDSPLRGMRR